MSREVFHPGERIGEYGIEGRLRSGGMATLFLGRRHGVAGFSRPVVIKVIHPHMAEDERTIQMFIDEARISSYITHPNVVRVDEFGEHEGDYYMVMEYVDGCSIDQLLRSLSRQKQRLSVEAAVNIAIAVADGLHAAHETVGADGAPLGIVHRDVSPSNILLTRAGHVKLIDFGIAKARGRLAGTKSGAGLKGKIRYMAPEQAWGREIDRRTDVYALGVVLWELLTGRELFRAAEDLAVLEMVRDPVIPPPSRYNPDVPAELDAVIARATAKEPGNRPANAAAFRGELVDAVPRAAMAVHASTIARMVTDAQAIIPSTKMRAQTPRPSEEIPQTGDSIPTSLAAPSRDRSPVPTPTARGEISAPLRVTVTVNSRRRRTMAAALAGGVVVAVVGFYVATRGGSGGDGPAPLPPLPTPATTSAPVVPAGSWALPSLPSGSAAPAQPGGAPATAVEPTPPAELHAEHAVEPTPVPTPGKRPVTRRRSRSGPAEPAGPTGPTAVEVDGVVLADDAPPPPEPKKKKKRKPGKPREGIDVDGTVLAP